MRTFRLLALGAFFCLSLSVAFAEGESSAAAVDAESGEVDVPPVVETVVDTPEEGAVEEATEEEEPIVDTEEEEPIVDTEEQEPVVAEAEVVETTETDASEEEAAAEEAETEALLKESEELSVPVSFIKDTVLAKVSEITGKITLTKENAKKTAAFALGAWGAATGVGWAVQQMGTGKKD